MIHAIRLYQTGGPEVLVWEQIQIGQPGPGEARVRHTAVGVNFVDVYIRKGLYPVPLPSGLGTEAAGTVQEIGPGLTQVKVGDRIAYAGGALGAYSEERLVPADRLVVLPPGISDIQAAAMMLKGLTTQFLIRQIFQVKQGDIILFHAAAGGVGLIACQWAKTLGATVIGTVGSEQKAQIAKNHGCADTVVPLRAALGYPLAARSIDPVKFKEYISLIRTLALFDARPEWDLNSDLQPRDGGAAAGAIMRVLLGGDDGYRYGEVVQFAKRVWVHSAARWRRQRRVRPHLRR